MKSYLLGILLGAATVVNAQSERRSDFNNTNWLQTINTIRIDQKFGVHLEYQWRRENGFRNWQQSLLRAGINYKLNEAVTLHLGYGFIQTFGYGDYPALTSGSFPEHRIYEQLNLRQALNKWTFAHRFRIEQRWLRRIVNSTSGSAKDWYFLHRFRYQFRVQRVLWKKTEKELYSAAADEIFIGAGKNLGLNIFDQNRLFGLLGYRINKHLALEAGYFNQTLQQGRPVNNQIIIQRNNGMVGSVMLNL